MGFFFLNRVISYLSHLLTVNLSDSLCLFPFHLATISLSISLTDTGMLYLGEVHHSAVISPETARELIGITLQTSCSS